MFNGIKVIDADGHVMEPNELYDQYLESKFKPELEELKKIAVTRPSKWFFGYFHQLNTGRPLGVAGVDKPLMRTRRKPHGEKPDARGGFHPHIPIQDMGREGNDIGGLFGKVVSRFCAVESSGFESA